MPTTSRSRRGLPIAAVLILSAAALILSGCEVRDESPRGGPASPWLPAVVERLAGPSRRLSGDASLAPRSIEFVEGYEAGSRRAADGGLPMVLVFRAAWCRWSRGLVGEALADPRLEGLAGSFVAVAIDADRDAATCRSFGVDTFPTAIVLDRSRQERFRATGAAVREGLAGAVVSATTEPPQRMARQPAEPAAR